jgi:hypothetical protein
VQICIANPNQGCSKFPRMNVLPKMRILFLAE